LADADVVKEHDHVVAASELRAAHEKEHRRERHLGELDEQAKAVQPRHRMRVRLAPSAQCAPRQRRSHEVERRHESDDTKDLHEIYMVQHRLILRSREKRCDIETRPNGVLFHCASIARARE